MAKSRRLSRKLSKSRKTSRKPCSKGKIRDRITKRCRSRKTSRRKSRKSRKSSRRKSRKSRKSSRRKSVNSLNYWEGKSGRIFSKDCVFMKTAKYKNRPSPPYPANKCKNRFIRGNDGNFYESIPDKNGIYKWKISK